MEKLIEQKNQSGPFQIVLDCRTAAEKETSENADFEKTFLEEGLLIGSYINVGRKKGFKEATFPFVQRVSCCVSKPENDGSEQKISIKSSQVKLSKCTKDLEQLNKWAEEGKIRPRISEQIEFSPQSIQAGLEKLVAGSVIGKLVIQVTHEDEEKNDGLDTTTIKDDMSVSTDNSHQHNNNNGKGNASEQMMGATALAGLTAAAVDSHTTVATDMGNMKHNEITSNGLSMASIDNHNLNQMAGYNNNQAPMAPNNVPPLYSAVTGTATTMPPVYYPPINPIVGNNNAGVMPPNFAPPAYAATLPAAMNHPTAGYNNNGITELNFVPVPPPYFDAATATVPATMNAPMALLSGSENGKKIESVCTAVVVDEGGLLNQTNMSTGSQGKTILTPDPTAAVHDKGGLLNETKIHTKSQGQTVLPPDLSAKLANFNNGSTNKF